MKREMAEVAGAACRGSLKAKRHREKLRGDTGRWVREDADFPENSKWFFITLKCPHPYTSAK